jgi:outer membrane biosynthesis protein TonB
MSVPVTERPRVSAATIPAQRARRGRGGSVAQKAAEQSARKAPTARTPAARSATGWGAATVVQQRPTGTQKAYARRDERLRRLAGGPAVRGATSGRAQFVLLVMVLLGVGLVATLWLSTAAAADSYRLQDARAAARLLSSQSERLHREVASMESAPELARRASGIGMVAVQDPARLVVAPDGTVTVVGVPMPAKASAPPVPAAPRPAQQPASQPGPASAPADATSQTPTDQEAPVPVAGTAAEQPGAAEAGAAGAGATGDPAATDPAAADTAGTAAAGPAADTATDGPPAIGARPAERTGAGREGAGEDGNGAGPAQPSGTSARSGGNAAERDSTNRDTAGTGSRAATGARAGGTAAGAG